MGVRKFDLNCHFFFLLDLYLVLCGWSHGGEGPEAHRNKGRVGIYVHVCVGVCVCVCVCVCV